MSRWILVYLRLVIVLIAAMGYLAVALDAEAGGCNVAPANNDTPVAVAAPRDQVKLPGLTYQAPLPARNAERAMERQVVMMKPKTFNIDPVSAYLFCSSARRPDVDVRSIAGQKPSPMGAVAQR